VNVLETVEAILEDTFEPNLSPARRLGDYLPFKK